jgi:hypothetical protein
VGVIAKIGADTTIAAVGATAAAAILGAEAKGQKDSTAQLAAFQKGFVYNPTPAAPASLHPAQDEMIAALKDASGMQ